VSDISPSAVKVTPALEEALKNADASEIPSIMRQAMLDQNLVKEDWSPDYLMPVEQRPEPQKVGRVIVLNGVKHSLVAEDEAGLLAQETAIYRAAMAQPVATPERTEQPRNERGQFTAAEPSVSDEEKAALSLQFSLGQVDIDTYLEKSGAVADYLEKAGVPLAELQATVSEKQNERISQDWQSATQEFMAGSGSWWPGGEDNMHAIGKVLLEMGAESEPSAENLRRAAEYLRDTNQLVEPPEITQRNREAELSQRIGEITDPYLLRDTLQPGSGLFAR
jgi:hypothetical protein